MKIETCGDLIIKKINNIDKEGVLDPKVREVAINPEKYEYIRKDIDSSFIFKGIPVGMIRSRMGWNNVDLSRGIETINKKIIGENGEIPIKIYSSNSSENMPCLVFLHGGGFFGGGVDTVENPCKLIAERAKCVVVSVDYRLAPENPFPKGMNDCFDAIKWVYNNAKEIKVDKNKIGVSGDSAGGNLAAVCTLKDRDLKTNMIKYQALLYPVLNLSNDENEYYKWNINDYEMKEDIDIIKGYSTALKDSTSELEIIYVQNSSLVKDRYVSPLLADNLNDLPKTLIATAEFDYLRPQGESYADRLKKENIDCRVIRYKGVDHAFIDKLGLYDQAEDLINEIVRDIINF